MEEECTFDSLDAAKVVLLKSDAATIHQKFCNSQNNEDHSWGALYCNTVLEQKERYEIRNVRVHIVR